LPRGEVPKDLDADDEIVKQILSYFLHSPNAMDSVEGVSRWRLLQERINRTVEESQVALEWLVDKGYLTPVNRVGSKQLFSLDINHRAEALRFLEGKKSKRRLCDKQSRGDSSRPPAKKSIEHE
jgi:hypothetical protein